MDTEEKRTRLSYLGLHYSGKRLFLLIPEVLEETAIPIENAERGMNMICIPTHGKRKFVLGLIGILLIIGIYSYISHSQHVINPHDTTIPNLSQIVEGVKKVCMPDNRGDIWIVADSMATAGRLFVGLSIGVVGAIILGMAMGCYTPLASMFMPVIVFVSKIPPTAMLAVYFVLFGMDFQLVVAIIALGVLPSLTVAVYSSVQKDVNENLIHKSYTLGASNLDVVEAVVFRQIFPRILQNIQLQIGPAMVFLIAVEWLVANIGFGYRLRMQSRLLNMNVVYVYLGLLGLAGFLIEYTLVILRRKT